MSASPPPSNLLLDPLSELTSALQLNAFGLDAETTQLIIEESFPVTPEDIARIGIETVRSGEIGEGVTAKAKVGLRGGEGVLVVVLDRRGFTLIETTTTAGKTYPNQTFESLEALLIGVSPAYVTAMTAEIQRRFADHDFGQVEYELEMQPESVDAATAVPGGASGASGAGGDKVS